jgi:hypothetical protein
MLINNGRQAPSAPSPTELGFTRVRHFKLPKSDKSDFGGERERTEIVALSSTLIVKLLRAQRHVMRSQPGSGLKRSP